MSDSNSHKVKDFYNEFSEKQLKTGVNLRHRLLHRWVKGLGLKSSSIVLEVGCGIGTYSSLLLTTVKAGKVICADISDKNIELAKKALSHHSNASFVLTDMVNQEFPIKFDFIILPDVLEHIPITQHQNLFEVFRKHTHPDSVVVINIPHFRTIQWYEKNKPELLQVIDQPLSTQDLLNNAYPSDFYLDQLVSYPLFHQECDYQFIVLRRNKAIKELPKQSKVTLKKRTLWAKLFG